MLDQLWEPDVQKVAASLFHDATACLMHIKYDLRQATGYTVRHKLQEGLI